MTADDLEEFSATLQTAAVGYYQQPVSAETTAMYFDALSDLDLRQVKDAIKRHVKTPERGAFFPRVADLIAKAREAREERNDENRGAPRLLQPETDDEDRTKWLSTDPVERSQQIWALVIQQIAYTLEHGRAGRRPLPDSANTRGALLESGAFVNLPGGFLEPECWQRFPKRQIGELVLVPWAKKFHGPFRQAYLRRHGIEMSLAQLCPEHRRGS